MMERFVAALHVAGVTVDYRQVQDILWLSRWLPARAETTGAPSDTPSTLVTNRRDESPAAIDPIAHVAAAARERPVTRPDVDAGVYIPSPTRAGAGTTRASAVRVPAVAALPGSAAIARSLRPFMRRGASTRHEVFDADATVEHFAETAVLSPVMRHAEERWFEIALVVDDSPSMVVWHRAAAELHRLLERQGAFSDVRRWTLLSTASKLQIVGQSGLVRHWRELRDPSSRRLVVVFSDFVGRHWYADEPWRMLSALGTTTPVVLLHVLPERLWPSTAIGDGSTVVSNRMPGAPNSTWDVERAWWQVDDIETGLAVPVITLQPLSTGMWARLVMAAGGASAPAVSARAPAERREVVDEGSTTADERVQRFKGFVSPTAYQLAVYFSAVPLSLPVMRLVQQAMLPDSHQVHLAEFFVGGLIERVSPADPSLPQDEVVYDFYPGVRDVLQGSLTRPAVMRVLQAVSRYLEEQFGQPLDFRALIPDAEGPFVLPQYAMPFATLGAQLLAKVGHSSVGVITPTATDEDEEAGPAEGSGISRDVHAPRRFRVFISGPSDVIEERRAAHEILEALSRDPSWTDLVTIEIVNRQAVAARLTNVMPQQGLEETAPSPADCDLTVVIVWGRMGVPNVPLKTDPSRLVSGTEYEFLEATNAGRRTLVCRRVPLPLISSKEDSKEKRQQASLVEQFFEQFRNQDGTILSNYFQYESVEEFRDKFEIRAPTMLLEMLTADAAAATPSPADPSDVAQPESTSANPPVPPAPPPPAPASEAASAAEEPSAEGFTVVPVYVATTRKRTDSAAVATSFGVEPGELETLLVNVSIPAEHRPGDVERPRMWRFEFGENPERHVVIQDAQPLSMSELAYARSTGPTSVPPLIMIHGWHKSFEHSVMDAATRTFDLAYEGRTILYAWPSQGSVTAYPDDELSAEAAVVGLQEVLSRLSESPTQSDLIAWDLGCSIVITALERVRPNGSRRAWRNLILVTPQMDAELFSHYAQALVERVERITIYCSPDDNTSTFARRLHSAPRLGAAGTTTGLEGVDLIEFRTADFIGQSYSFGRSEVSSDIYHVLRGLEPGRRFGLRPRSGGGWLLEP